MDKSKAASSREREICAAARERGDRLGSTLWRVAYEGEEYFVHERYDGRKTWFTAHAGAPNGPRVSNSY